MLKFKCQCLFQGSPVFFVVVAALMLNLLSGSVAFAQAGDEFEGAVWRFSMTPKVRGDKALRGEFRVSDLDIFQKESRDDESFRKTVGKKFPNGEHTKIVFKELYAMRKDDEPNRGKRVQLSGTVMLNFDEPGEWSGRFVDGDGHRWDFKCSRIKE